MGLGIGMQFKILLTKKGLTQKLVCIKTGITPAKVGLLAKDRYIPDDDEIDRLATFLNLDIDAFKKGKIKELSDKDLEN